MTDAATLLPRLADDLAAGRIVPYLGPEVLTLSGEVPVPTTSAQLVSAMTAKAAVPGRIRHNLTAAAQYIESHRHRRTLEGILAGVFGKAVAPSPFHRWLAGLNLPLIVDVWYDDTMERALAERADNWGQVQGLGHPQSNQEWVRWFGATGELTDSAVGSDWRTLLYKPMGSVSPQGNFLISDSDLVEVLTEIDIQTPIPDAVTDRRAGRSFLFLGCRFDGEVSRTFARQISKRSGDRHYAVLPAEPTRNEARFLENYNIERIGLPLAEAAALLTGAVVA